MLIVPIPDCQQKQSNSTGVTLQFLFRRNFASACKKGSTSINNNFPNPFHFQAQHLWLQSQTLVLSILTLRATELPESPLRSDILN